jgi:hypothetical protein
MYDLCNALAWLNACAPYTTCARAPSIATFFDPIFTQKRQLHATGLTPRHGSRSLKASAKATFFRVARQQAPQWSLGL